MEIRYYKTSNQYLANSLSFLGFRYYVFDNSRTNNIREYGFVDSNDLQMAMSELIQMKKKYNKYKI